MEAVKQDEGTPARLGYYGDRDRDGGRQAERVRGAVRLGRAEGRPQT